MREVQEIDRFLAEDEVEAGLYNNSGQVAARSDKRVNKEAAEAIRQHGLERRLNGPFNTAEQGF